MGRNAGEVRDWRVGQQRQYKACQQQETAGGDDLAQFEAAGEAVQALARS